jgi:1,2-phenylacetyl-CoA epoxidase PaaB subunit
VSYASLGPLTQAEIMADFPEKVSDWTVMNFYPKRKKVLGVQRKAYHDVQSLSGKPVIKTVKIKKPICAVWRSLTDMGKIVKWLG